MSVATRTGERIELTRYRTAHAERVVVGQRVLGIVRVSDVPATGRGRRYLVERELTLKAELDARRRLPRGSGGPGRLSHAGLAGRPRAGGDAMSAPRRHFNLDRLLGTPPSQRERREWLWRMTPHQRVYAGRLTLADCLAWAARYPDEPPTINGEWAFIAIRTPEVGWSRPKPGSATPRAWPVTGRGSGPARGLITGTATFLGGTFHSLPFLISNVDQARVVAYAVVALELVAIALIRKRFLRVSLAQSLVQVTLGGAIVAGVGFALGQA